MDGPMSMQPGAVPSRDSTRRRRGGTLTRASLAGVLVLALGAGGCGKTGPIAIGVAGPMKQAPGRSERQAAEMAVEAINAAGGVRGRHLTLVIKDDGADPQQAIRVAGELSDDPQVVAVVGHINSPATLAAAPIYNDSSAHPVVELSPASSSPLITNAGPWTFRVCPTDLQHGPALADWAYNELGSRHAEIIYSNDAYGRGVLQSFVEAYVKDGGHPVGEDPYLPAMLKTGREIDPYLQRALRDSVDALVIAGQAAGAAKIVAESRRLGYHGPILGPDGITGLQNDGPLAEGVYISSAFLPDQPGARAQAFVKAYEARFHEPPDHRAAMTYDAVRLLAQAIAKVGTGRRAIRDYLASVGHAVPAFQGVSGRIAFDGNGDVAGKQVTIGVVHDGRLITATPPKRASSASRPEPAPSGHSRSRG